MHQYLACLAPFRVAMMGSSDEGLRALQREIQRLLGECLLRLQACERLAKATVDQHDISWPVHFQDKAEAVRTADLDRKTLGTVINQLLESFLTSGEKASSPEPAEDGPPLRIRIQLGFSADDFTRIESDLREFVSFRNDLVHHFIDQRDLGSLDGCREAEEALIAASCRIKHRLNDLRQWVDELERVRLKTAEIIKSDAIRDLVADGTIPWHITEIVRVLQEAAAELAQDGWTHIATAGEWVSARYPLVQPKDYGCGSWRQVLHESGLFELRRDRQAGGQRACWFRVKGHESNSQ